ncbi:MAG TPA: patatin-like phospholipase family protein [Acidimicrobiales bacterium]|nr:patatin-like phospholipase family protein [Acidimicrobiales bacterium]
MTGSANGTPSDGASRRTGRFAPWRRRHHPVVEPVTAFVLAGGGSRGAVQVGMLTELVERGIRADRVYGASVGAVNGAAYCSDPTPAGMSGLQEVWLGLDGEDVFPRSRVHGPWKFFQTRPAVHPNDGLRRVIETGLAFERLEDAAVPIEIVATSLVDGHERWFTEGPTVEAVLASAAIPALLPPVAIDGDLLIDGGVVNNVPITRAIEQGATRVYVLLCGPLHFRPTVPRRPVEAVLTALFLSVHARLERDLAAVPPGVEVVVFSGDEAMPSDYRDFSGTAAFIEAGRAEVAATLEHRVGARALESD